MEGKQFARKERPCFACFRRDQSEYSSSWRILRSFRLIQLPLSLLSIIFCTRPTLFAILVPLPLLPSPPLPFHVDVAETWRTAKSTFYQQIPLKNRKPMINNFVIFEKEDQREQ